MSGITKEKINEWIKFLNDIEDPLKDDKKNNKLNTHQKWYLTDTSTKNKIIKKYLFGLTNLPTVNLVSNGITKNVSLKAATQIFTFDSKECLNIVISSLKLNTNIISNELFESIYLEKESCEFFRLLFWYIFYSYFIIFNTEKQLDILLDKLSISLLKFNNASAMQELLKNDNNINNNKTEDRHRRLDYFYNTYIYCLTESLYVLFIRYFCGNTWLVDYNLRNKILSDIYYLFNGVPISDLTQNKQFDDIFPNGTDIPKPILWNHRAITPALKSFTFQTNEINDFKSRTIMLNNKVNVNQIRTPLSKGSILVLNDEGVKNITVESLLANKDDENEILTPIQFWLRNKSEIKRKDKRNDVHTLIRKRFESRMLSPLVSRIIKLSGLSGNKQFIFHEVPYNFKLKNPSIKKLKNRQLKIEKKYQNATKKIAKYFSGYHYLATKTNNATNTKK